MNIRESSPYCGGSILIDPVWGRCRVVHGYDDKISFVIGIKPLTASADAWARILEGKVLRWTDDREMRVEQELQA